MTRLIANKQFDLDMITGSGLTRNRRGIVKQLLAYDGELIDVSIFVNSRFPTTYAKTDEDGRITIFNNICILASLLAAIERAELEDDVRYLNALLEANIELVVAYPSIDDIVIENMVSSIS